MMKGAFGIEVVRNGRKLRLDFNNRILTSGLDFQNNFSVTNNADSIIKELFFGNSHSVIDSTTTGMAAAPIAVVPYTDYITPDFSDETAEFFLNRLVFRYEPQSTMVIRQVGTGRKEITNIGGVESTKYHYFSLANLVDAEGKLAELTVYQGDIITVTYDLTIFNYVDLGSYDFRNSDIVWNMVRANPNWQLSGLQRKIDVAKLAMWDLWGQQFEPFIKSNTIGTTNSNQTYYQYLRRLFYRNITVAYKVGNVTAAELKADPKYKKYISMAGSLPYWNTSNDIYYGTVNGVNHFETYTGFMSCVMGTERQLFDPENKYPDIKPTIADVQQTIGWGSFSSSVKISAKITPFAAVAFTYQGKIKPMYHNGMAARAMFGYADKTGYWSATLPISDFLAASSANDPVNPMCYVTAYNDAGIVKSTLQPFVGKRNGLNPRIINTTLPKQGIVGKLTVAVQSHTTPTSGNTMNVKVVKTADKSVVVYNQNKIQTSGTVYNDSYFGTSFSISLNDVANDVDLFDGSYSVYIEFNGLFYELPIGTEESKAAPTIVEVRPYGPKYPHVKALSTLQDVLLVDVKLTKSS